MGNLVPDSIDRLVPCAGTEALEQHKRRILGAATNAVIEDIFMNKQPPVRPSFLILLLLLFLVPMQTVLAEDYNFPGLRDTVTVYEDQLGIPSIRAKHPLDAVFMQGYMHARDRFFQMDRDRKGAAGRAAEMFGEGALADDLLYRTFGLERAAWKTWQALDDKTKGWLQSYANGVNTYLQNNPLPPEYAPLEITKADPWLPVHSLLIVKGLDAQQGLDDSDIYSTFRLGAYTTVGSIGGFDGQALYFEDTHRYAPPDDRVTAPEFLQAQAASSTEAAGGGKNKARIEWTGSQEVPEAMFALAEKYIQSMAEAPGAQKFMQRKDQPFGSNAWLISGEHTATGNAMIANDPHMTLNTPAIWYESQMIFRRAGEDWYINGVNVPGLPAALLGCNNVGCWGFTNNSVDGTDFYMEAFQVNSLGLPTHTLYKGNPEPMQLVINSWYVNVIGDGEMDNKVRANIGYTDGAVTWVIPRRNDGPLLQPDMETNTALSMAYTANRDTHEASLVWRFGTARNLDEVIAAMQYFDAGSQNVYWADVMGNIAWFNGSEVPVREDLANFTVDGLPPWFIRDGTGAAANEWLPVANPQSGQALDYEMVPFAEIPHLINPAKGYVLNANNDPIGATLDNNPVNQVRPSGQGLLYLGAYYPAYRMGRLDREVKAMIDAGHKITLDDMKALQANVEMLDAELTLPTLLGIMSQVPVPEGSPVEQALDVLSTWDYSAKTGLAEGWDAGSSPLMMVAPSLEEVRNSAAATVWAMWRSMLVRNTIYATLNAIGLGDYLPPSRAAYRAFVHHLENYPTAGGVGASGIPFFSAGLAETVAGSLQQALEMLASNDFAPAYANSTNVLDYAWGKLHRIVFDHTLGAPFDIPNWGPFMDLSPELPGFARQGGFEVLDASGHSATADGLNEFMFGGGPARRFVADMGPVAVNAQQMIAGGQSGIILHPNYGQALTLWLTNTYHPMALGEGDAAGVAVSITTFGPPAAATAEEN